MLDKDAVFNGRSVAELRKGIFRPGARVYTSLHSVSQSGMTRRLSVYVVHDGRIKNATFLVASILERGTDKDGHIVMRGCGMDMGFKLVYDLSCALYHGTRFKCARDARAGYALRHEWL